MLAGVGTTWYTWLEQGRDVRPSADALSALADALRLDQTERRHLFTLHDRPLPDEDVAPEVVDATGAQTVAGEDDADDLPVTVDVRVRTGARVPVGSCELEVIELVGHTPGSIALAYDDPDGIVHLFTGDSLFPGGVGKTGSAEDFALLVTQRREIADTDIVATGEARAWLPIAQAFAGAPRGARP